MNDRPKKILLGCAAACGVVVILGIGSCLAFTSWLRAPGEMLEEAQMLDSDAVGYAEWRLDLEDAGTKAIVDAAIEAMNGQGDELAMPSFIRVLLDFSNRRQARKLKDLFPATAVWSLYPDAGADRNLYSVSVQRLGHRLVFADWVMGWLLPWAPDEIPAVTYRGETILSLEEGDGKEMADEGSSLHAFLSPKGIFFADDLEGAKKAVDRLAGGGIEIVEESGPSRLERLYARLDPGLPLRGAVSNRRGELVRLARRLEGDGGDGGGGASLDPRLEAALAQVDAVIWSGGPVAGGDLILEVLFFADAAAEIEEPIRARVRALQEAWSVEGAPLEVEVTETADGVGVSLRVVDVAKRISEWRVTGARSAGRLEEPRR